MESGHTLYKYMDGIECVAVRCSALQCVVLYCSVLRCVAAYVIQVYG